LKRAGVFITGSFKMGLESDVFVWGSLVDMYAKCGNIEDVGEFSSRCHLKMYVVTWNTILGGCSMHGHGRETLEQMCEKGVQPNDITFVCLL
jgi:pentatricopeptide repeat protein